MRPLITRLCHAVLTSSLRGNRQHLGHAHHVVADHAQLHEPTDLGSAAQLGSTQQSVLLAALEALLDALSKALTESVSGVSRSACINGAAASPISILCHLCGHLALAQRGHELACVVSLVSRQRAAASAALAIQHPQCRLALGRILRSG